MTRMVHAALIAVLLATALTQHAHAACEMTQYASADLEIAPSGGVLVPVTVNGHEVWMGLNMASGLAIISPTALAPLGLKAGMARADQLYSNGVKIQQETKAESLRVGGADFSDWILHVQPGAGRPLVVVKGRPVVGSLSSRFMNVVDMELDLGGRKLNLFKQTRCRGGAVYWGGEVTTLKLYKDPSGLLLFPMEIDGQYVEATLNTGDRRTWLSEIVTRDFFRFDRTSPGIAFESGGPAGRVPVRPMSLTARGLALRDVSVTLQDQRGKRCMPTRSDRESGAIGFRNCFSIVPLELGTDLLRRLRIYIASKEERIYFTRVDQPAPPAAGAGPAAPDGGSSGAAPAADAPQAAGQAAPGPAEAAPPLQ